MVINPVSHSLGNSDLFYWISPLPGARRASPMGCGGGDGVSWKSPVTFKSNKRVSLLTATVKGQDRVEVG